MEGSKPLVGGPTAATPNQLNCSSSLENVLPLTTPHFFFPPKKAGEKKRRKKTPPFEKGQDRVKSKSPRMAGERKHSPWNTRNLSVIDGSEHHREPFLLRKGLVFDNESSSEIFEGMSQKTESEADFVLFDAIPQTASLPSFFFPRTLFTIY